MEVVTYEQFCCVLFVFLVGWWEEGWEVLKTTENHYVLPKNL